MSFQVDKCGLAPQINEDGTHRFLLLRVCASFEEMQDKCRTVPQTSEELIELNSYMEEARCQGMVRMEQKIQVRSAQIFHLL